MVAGVQEKTLMGFCVFLLPKINSLDDQKEDMSILSLQHKQCRVTPVTGGSRSRGRGCQWEGLILAASKLSAHGIVQIGPLVPDIVHYLIHIMQNKDTRTDAHLSPHYIPGCIAVFIVIGFTK